MTDQTITAQERQLAETCGKCPVCQRAREKQKGLAYWFVKKIEGNLCPACQAYEKVNGRKAHEPAPVD